MICVHIYTSLFMSLKNTFNNYGFMCEQHIVVTEDTDGHSHCKENFLFLFSFFFTIVLLIDCTFYFFV